MSIKLIIMFEYDEMVDGKYYCYQTEEDENWIFIFTSEGGEEGEATNCQYCINVEGERYHGGSESAITAGAEPQRLATAEEKAHLDYCIEKERFVLRSHMVVKSSTIELGDTVKYLHELCLVVGIKKTDPDAILVRYDKGWTCNEGDVETDYHCNNSLYPLIGHNLHHVNARVVDLIRKASDIPDVDSKYESNLERARAEYPIGTVIKDASSTTGRQYTLNIEARDYSGDDTRIAGCESGGWIYYRGKWAEIISKPGESTENSKESKLEKARRDYPIGTKFVTRQGDEYTATKTPWCNSSSELMWISVCEDGMGGCVWTETEGWAKIVEEVEDYTDEEVEKLLAEANERYPKGTVYNPLDRPTRATATANQEAHNTSDHSKSGFCIEVGYGWVFSNGKWADIIENTPAEPSMKEIAMEKYPDGSYYKPVGGQEVYQVNQSAYGESGSGDIEMGYGWIYRKDSDTWAEKLTTGDFFQENQYIVILTDDYSYFSKDNIYKIRKNSLSVDVYRDNDGDENTRPEIKFEHQHDEWRFASADEIIAYDKYVEAEEPGVPCIHYTDHAKNLERANREFPMGCYYRSAANRNSICKRVREHAVDPDGDIDCGIGWIKREDKWAERVPEHQVIKESTVIVILQPFGDLEEGYMYTQSDDKLDICVYGSDSSTYKGAYTKTNEGTAWREASKKEATVYKEGKVTCLDDIKRVDALVAQADEFYPIGTEHFCASLSSDFIETGGTRDTATRSGNLKYNRSNNSLSDGNGSYVYYNGKWAILKNGMRLQEDSLTQAVKFTGYQEYKSLEDKETITKRQQDPDLVITSPIPVVERKEVKDNIFNT